MIVAPVRAAVRAILLAVPGLPPGRQWEGRRFTPTTGIAWLSEALDPVSSGVLTIGREGLTEDVYLYRIDLRYPTGTVSDADDVADGIRHAFYVGRKIAAPTPFFMSGQVRRSERRRTEPGEVWTSYPVRIEFYLHRPTVIAAA